MKMSKVFTKKTFQYFDLAQKNSKKREWFDKNEEMYLEHVREPFSELIKKIYQEFQNDLPKIKIDPKSITRPLRPKNKMGEQGIIKSHSHITLWEKRTSLFEWNPGIHIQFGAKKDDNFLGMGLYMTSSRQLSLFRDTCWNDFEKIEKILKDKKLKKEWGEVLGEKYKRFPKGYDSSKIEAKYLWYKQFYLGKEFKRSEVCDKNFTKEVIRKIKVGLPFFVWIRNTVGAYQKRRIPTIFY